MPKNSDANKLCTVGDADAYVLLVGGVALLGPAVARGVVGFVAVDVALESDLKLEKYAWVTLKNFTIFIKLQSSEYGKAKEATCDARQK